MKDEIKIIGFRSKRHWGASPQQQSNTEIVDDFAAGGGVITGIYPCNSNVIKVDETNKNNMIERKKSPALFSPSKQPSSSLSYSISSSATTIACIECGYRTICPNCAAKRKKKSPNKSSSVFKASSTGMMSVSSGGKHKDKMHMMVAKALEGQLPRTNEKKSRNAAKVVAKWRKEQNQSVGSSYSINLNNNDLMMASLSLSSSSGGQDCDNNSKEGNNTTRTAATTANTSQSSSLLSSDSSSSIPRTITTQQQNSTTNSRRISRELKPLVIECQGRERIIPKGDLPLSVKLKFLNERNPHTGDGQNNTSNDAGRYRYYHEEQDAAIRNNYNFKKENMVLIKNPEWTKTIALHILELLRTSKTNLLINTKDGRREMIKEEDYPNLLRSMDVEIPRLLPGQSLIIRHPINRQHDIKYDTQLVQEIIKVWRQRKHEFVFTFQNDGSSNNLYMPDNDDPSKTLNMYIWGKLLEQGIIFLDAMHMFSVESHQENMEDNSTTRFWQSNSNNRSRHHKLLPILHNNNQTAKSYKVGCIAPLYVSVYHACTLLYMNNLPSKQRLSFTKTKLDGSSEHIDAVQEISRRGGINNNKVMLHVYLYLGSCSAIEEELLELQQQEGGSGGGNRSSKFDDINFTYERTYEGQEAAWITGSPGNVKILLEKVIKQFIIPTRFNLYCIICISNPSILMLGRFIYACQQCEQNKAVMIFNHKANDFLVSRIFDDAIVTLDILSSSRSNDDKYSSPTSSSSAIDNNGNNIATSGPITILGTTRDFYRKSAAS